MAVQNACFLIADISGYTNYLTAVELDHAEDILADLMNTVVTSLRPFHLAKLEGDAAFAYTVTDDLDGHLLQDTIDGTYFAFQRRLRDIEQSTTCQCNACSRMTSLDLKFVVHHGKTIIQKVAGNDELVGSDVILVHRLLKNSVSEKLGERAYALFTDGCVQEMGVDPVSHGLVEHVEHIDIIGDVKTWLEDLNAAWLIERDGKRVLVSRDAADVVVEGEIAAPRSLVWKYHAVPELRVAWQGSQALTEDTSARRRGVGTINHCAHGPNTVVEHILDWRPPDYATLTTHVANLPGSEPLLLTMVMKDTADGGTHVEYRFTLTEGANRKAFDEIMVFMKDSYNGNLEVLRGLIENQPGDAAVQVPEIVPSRRRYRNEPVS